MMHGSLADWRVPVPGSDAGAAVISDEPDLDGADASSAERQVERTCGSACISTWHAVRPEPRGSCGSGLVDE